MEDVLCDREGHHALEHYFHLTESLRMITGIRLELERNKVQNIVNAIGEVTFRYSFYKKADLSQLRSDIEAVWDMVYTLAKNTDANSQYQDSLVYMLMCTRDGSPIRRPSHFGQPHAEECEKMQHCEKKGLGAKAESRSASKTRESTDAVSEADEESEDAMSVDDDEEAGVKLEGSNLSSSNNEISANGVAELLDESTVKTKEDPNKEPPSIVITDGMTVWSDLPYLDSFLRPRFFNLMALPMEKRCNFSSFIGRLVSVGADDYRFGQLALWLLRETLEVSRPGKTDTIIPSEETGTEQNYKENKKKSQGPSKVKQTEITQETYDNLPITEFLPPCVALLEQCGRKLSMLSERQLSFKAESCKHKQWTSVGKLAEGVGAEKTGFSLARWIFWRSRLRTLIMFGGGEIAEDARRAFNVITFVGRISGVDIPGDLWYFGNLVKYRYRLPNTDPRDTNDDLEWIDD
ncbi:uncharacterized protein GIQ15_01827 [Arthroderma uncinatum]|uniref:uncharacterized protein n=1 Tax=Arthroderma uncinatum TaxID=74035 RepID=UPI00144AE74B|nr:uncharacterized protein GIQ15_01827 [Arthroderma uncinatum]KAF3492310.1 hypothetical protein GIQ15_01827 [Arthroderma uncinatum]